MKWRSLRFPAFSIWFLSVCSAAILTWSGTFVIKLTLLHAAVWVVSGSWYEVKNARSLVLRPWHMTLHCCTCGSPWHFLSLLPSQVKQQYHFCNECTFRMARRVSESALVCCWRCLLLLLQQVYKLLRLRNSKALSWSQKVFTCFIASSSASDRRQINCYLQTVGYECVASLCFWERQNLATCACYLQNVHTDWVKWCQSMQDIELTGSFCTYFSSCWRFTQSQAESMTRHLNMLAAFDRVTCHDVALPLGE